MGGQEIKASLGINIKSIRAFRHFSQAVLAEKADISVAYLSKIERGIKYPKPDVLSKIAEGLGVEVYELFKPDEANHGTEIDADVSAKVVKYLDMVDDTLVKQITHSIQPALERAIQRSVAKTRRYYEQQAAEEVSLNEKAKR